MLSLLRPSQINMQELVPASYAFKIGFTSQCTKTTHSPHFNSFWLQRKAEQISYWQKNKYMLGALKAQWQCYTWMQSKLTAQIRDKHLQCSHIHSHILYTTNIYFYSAFFFCKIYMKKRGKIFLKMMCMCWYYIWILMWFYV